MRTYAVIGKNFGDEGKGLVSASLCLHSGKKLIVRHNGGGQAGHTVECTAEQVKQNKVGKPEKNSKATKDCEPAKNSKSAKDGMLTKDSVEFRFIHHQIGSGAEFGADTLFAETFCPDLYQLGNELEQFEAVYGFRPVIFSEKNTAVTIIDDILLNMALETFRGDKRHGSCGMGINECRQRMNAGYVLTVGDIAEHNVSWIIDRLRAIREKYTMSRAEILGLPIGNAVVESSDDGKIIEDSEDASPYAGLTNEDILLNFAAEIKKNVAEINIIDADRTWLEQYDLVVFETGQGLLLDEFYRRYAPYLTTSRTGIANTASFLDKRSLRLDEVIYVTRSYVTRHGNGPLPCECKRAELPGVEYDMTNEPNEWQGVIRYARHQDFDAFFEAMADDLDDINKDIFLQEDITVSLAITHLNESDGKLRFETGDVGTDEFRSLFLGRNITGTDRILGNIYESYCRIPECLRPGDRHEER